MVFVLSAFLIGVIIAQTKKPYWASLLGYGAYLTMLVVAGLPPPEGLLLVWLPATFAFTTNLFGILLGLIANALGYAIITKLAHK